MRGIVAQLLPGAPVELLASVETLGDLVDWHRTHAGGGRHGEAAASRVRLRPLADSDLAALYEASTAPERGFRWRYRGTTPSLAEFHAQLFEGVLCQFIVETVADRVAHGLVCAYNAQFDQRFAYVAFVRFGPVRGRGEVLEGMMSFIEFLFRTWDLKKLYAEVPEFNAQGMFDLESRSVRVEGRLVDHCFHDGRWWDQLIVAVWREDWTALTRP